MSTIKKRNGKADDVMPKVSEAPIQFEEVEVDELNPEDEKYDPIVSSLFMFYLNFCLLLCIVVCCTKKFGWTCNFLVFVTYNCLRIGKLFEELALMV